MEHRLSSRYPATIAVQLYQHGKAVAWCQARDVGSDGIFVDTGPLFYRRHTLLDLEFEVEVNHQFHIRRKYRVPVTVVHNTNDGLGLMMLKAGREAHHAWQQVMDKARLQMTTATSA